MGGDEMELGSRVVTKNPLMVDVDDVPSPRNKSFGAASPTEAPLTNDELVLAGFGKKQQLKRRFKCLSSVSLTCGLLLTWLAELK